MIDVFKEFKDRIKRLEHERDIYRLIAIDEVQSRRVVLTREQAEEKVDMEVFQHLQGTRP